MCCLPKDYCLFSTSTIAVNIQLLGIIAAEDISAINVII